MTPTNSPFVRSFVLGRLAPLVFLIAAVSLLGCGGIRQPFDASRQEPKAAQPAPMPAMPPDALGKNKEIEHNTEAYDHIVENSFLAADRNPLSTFSIDVDTAS